MPSVARKLKPINIEIGLRVKAARERAGLTQARLGELVDLNSQSISAIECGVSGLSPTSMKRICEVLAISADTLLFDALEQLPDEVVGAKTELIHHIENLSPAQLKVALNMFNALLEAFATNESRG